MASVLETVVAVRDPLDALRLGFIKFFPALITVILLLAVGYLAGMLLGAVLKIILDKIGLDKYIVKSELSKAIGKVHVSAILGEILKWYVFIIFLGAAVDRVDLGALSGVLNSLVLWLPDLILAVVMVLVGLVIAHYVELKINEHTRVKGMQTLSKGLKWVILFVIIISALNQIGLEVSILEDVFLIIIGALAIGIALALGIGLGLGLRKYAENIIQEFIKNF